MRSIELTFDEQTDAAIRELWQHLSETGLPSLADHRGPTNRPHVTLAAGAHLEYSAAQRPALALPIESRFSGVLLFPAGRSRFVVGLGVVASPRLLELHARAHLQLTGAVDLTRPNAWSPHVTLSRRLTANQVAIALPVLDVIPSGRFVGARLWDSAGQTITELAATGPD